MAGVELDPEAAQAAKERLDDVFVLDAQHEPYQPSGLLDATHLRFFTHMSFAKLMLDAGFLPRVEELRERAAGRDEAERELADVQSRLEDRHRHIANMEASVFWKARDLAHRLLRRR